jgi:general secretion pathway protein A
MYRDYYGLRDLPFEITADPRFLYLPAKHREALSVLKYGVLARKGLTVLTGEAGLGKTTLVQTVFGDDAKIGVKALVISNPVLTRDEFLEVLADGFQLPLGAAPSKAVVLRELDRVLSEGRLVGRRYALVIDEAQSLPADLLEEVRLLGNMEHAAEKLLPIVLVGQPELADRLNEPGLRQLKQRVALRTHLAPFTLQETTAYIDARVRTAGGSPINLFTLGAVRLIHQRSRGIPRTINVICDNALVTGFALEQRPIGSDVIREVCRDFDLEQQQQIVIRGDDDEMVQPKAPEPVTAGYSPFMSVNSPGSFLMPEPLSSAARTGRSWLAPRRWLEWFS